MTIVPDRVSPDSDAFRANRDAMLAQLRQHDEQLAIVNGGGGPKYVERHRRRDKLMARERVEALLDVESPFLELSPLAAWGTE
ncbi:MAG: acyl-CoA carboxylase subunit beta, partial [Ilumatobacteraceae bacterium]